MKRVPLAEITDLDFRKKISESKSIKDFLERVGFSRNSGTMGIKVKERVEELGIDISHFIKRGVGRPTYSLEEILIENSPYQNIGRLKIRLVNEGLLEYKCESCSSTGWHLGRPLNLQLDHKNGICTDHRLKNLRFLCPNCHSQTDNYGGKNIKSYINGRP